MSRVRTSRKRLWWALLAVPVLVVSGVLVADQVRLRRWRSALRSSDWRVRSQMLQKIGREREGRLSDDVLSWLEHGEERAVIESAGYAAMRLGDARALAVLRDRAAAGPDDITRARLISFVGRLSDPDPGLIAWMNEGAVSSEPWRRVGSAIGLLEQEQVGGGVYLISMLSDLEPGAREVAIRDFKRVAEPMAQAIGYPLDFSGVDERAMDEVQWSEIRTFWDGHATPRLLADVLHRLERRDWKWYELNRLLHARDRFAELLGDAG